MMFFLLNFCYLKYLDLGSIKNIVSMTYYFYDRVAKVQNIY
jgi:hypothetical protein